MAHRLERALVLLNPAPLPVDLIDNPYRTGQWLSTVNALHQAVLVLLTDPGPGTRLPNAQPDSRADRLVRRFMRLTEGLPLACLSGLPAVTKLALLPPLLADIESRARRIASQYDLDAAAIEVRLSHYRASLGSMAARLAAPDGPASAAALRQPQTVPSR